MVGKHEYMNMGPRIYRVCYATALAEVLSLNGLTGLTVNSSS